MVTEADEQAPPLWCLVVAPAKADEPGAASVELPARLNATEEISFVSG